jgi:hypothetical protein
MARALATVPEPGVVSFSSPRRLPVPAPSLVGVRRPPAALCYLPSDFASARIASVALVQPA